MNVLDRRGEAGKELRGYKGVKEERIYKEKGDSL